MRSRLLIATASVLFLSSIPVAFADWGEHHEYMHSLRWACEQGSRHACFRLGQEVQERRDEWRRREAWREREAWSERWRYQPQPGPQPMWGWGWGRGW